MNTLWQDTVDEMKRNYLVAILKECGGNQCRAAHLLGLHRNTVSRLVAQLGIDVWALKGKQ